MTTYPLTLLFDGGCPLCRLEMERLRERDGLRRLVFVDITEDGFDAAHYTLEARYEDMQAAIHAVRKDGSLATGVEALRLAYVAVGLGWWVAPAQLPLLRPALDTAYAVFARHRYVVSRWLMPLIAGIESRRASRRAAACKNGCCSIDP